MSRTRAAKAVTLKPFGKAAMLAYQAKSGGPVRYHAFKHAERIEVSTDGRMIVIHCKVKNGEIQD